MVDEQGIITQSYHNYYEKLSAGGAGLIITGHMNINPRGRIFGLPDVNLDEQVLKLCDVVDTVHKNSSVIFAQLNYSDSKAVSKNKKIRPAKTWLPNIITKAEINTIVKDFGMNATRIRKMGFDGIQIQGGHTYIISQFLSKKINRRKDKYGGSLKTDSVFAWRFTIACVKTLEKIIL